MQRFVTTSTVLPPSLLFLSPILEVRRGLRKSDVALAPSLLFAFPGGSNGG